MQLFDLASNKEWHFSHHNPVAAFAYVIAERKRLMSAFSSKDKNAFFLRHVPVITVSDNGFHLGDLSIPFCSVGEGADAAKALVNVHNAAVLALKETKLAS